MDVASRSYGKLLIEDDASKGVHGRQSIELHARWLASAQRVDRHAQRRSDQRYHFSVIALAIEHFACGDEGDALFLGQ